MKKKGLALMLSIAMLFGSVVGAIPAVSTVASAEALENSKIIESPDIPLRLYYDEPASHGINTRFETAEGVGNLGDNSATKSANDDWVNWSIPIGNGYFGANVFGRTESERIQITEKTLANPYNSWGDSQGGLNNFSETYIDFGHTESEVGAYIRELDFKTATTTVSYTYNGVEYSREYFTSYPDKALVIKLTANTDGALDFTLRPTVPYEQSWSDGENHNKEHMRVSKTGEVASRIEGGVGVIELTGKLGCYDVDFMGLYRVYTDGTVSASTTEHKWTDSDGTAMNDTDGTIVVDGATTAYIYVTLGTDYEISYLNFTNDKPTYTTTLEDTRKKVEGEMTSLEAKLDTTSITTLEASYQAIKAAHVADFDTIFGRVDLDLNCNPADFELTTDELVGNYRNDTNNSTYLETLLFQYGRYLLISSSRKGALPANLQGVWNKFNYTPWSGGFWHNVNIQMNYWPAFSTNMAEIFEAYMDYADSYMPVLKNAADSLINTNNPSVSGQDGGNGWTIGVGGMPFSIGGQWSPGHLGFTTVMFYDYYAFTKDEEILDEAFVLLADAARYITKTVVEKDGKLLVEHCESPEQYHNGSLYYTDGTTYAQSFIYENNYNLIRLAKEMGVDIEDIDSCAILTADDKAILKTVLAQTDRYDPIVVGYSGQVKEFREEDYYGDYGAAQYVHISQLVGLYPGTIINSSTPAWQDAARVSLEGRGEKTEGWGYGHRINAYARLGDGDMSHLMLHNLIRDSIGNNLWSHYHVFQIDGNGGATSGISEMLLQSHEGFIAPLAAIPEGWSTGTYTGLVARGNFVVSADWADGLAKTFNITSQSGGEAKVYYPNISGALVVRASDGATITSTKVNEDMISFATTVGETYIISGFVADEKVEAPTSIGYSRARFGDFKLAVTPTESAASYNLYVAIESAPTYTLVDSSKTGYFTYSPEEENVNSRITFRATAVSASGEESEGTLCYYIPENVEVSVEDVIGNIINETQLQTIIKAEGAVSQYKFYARANANTEWVFQQSSDYPIIIKNDYTQGIQYGVSVVNAFDGTETEIEMIMRYGTATVDAYNSKNIFEGKTFVAGENASSVHKAANPGDSFDTEYGYSKLTDGDGHSMPYRYNRFSTVYKKDKQSLDAVIDLEQAYFLGTLTLKDYGSTFVGNGLQIFVYNLGKWRQLINWTRDEVLAHRVNGSASAASSVVIDLGGVRAEKLRIYVPTYYDNVENTISFYEFLCTGVADANEYASLENIFSGKSIVPTADAAAAVHGGASSVYGYPTLTDGITYNTNVHVGRFSGAASSSPQLLEGTVDLGGRYILGTMKLYSFGSGFAGNGLVVDAYNEGAWTNIVTISTETALWSYASGNLISVPLDAVQAEKVRIYIPDKGTATNVSLWEIECSGYAIGAQDVIGSTSSNILSPTNQFVPAPGVTWSPATFGYDKLTDHNIAGGGSEHNSGRFSTSYNSTDQKVDATATFGRSYLLEELRLYDYNGHTSSFLNSPNHAGADLLVQVLCDGIWVDVISCTSDEYATHRVYVSYKHGGAYLSFNLGGIVGEAVRIYQSGTVDGGVTNTITYYEIELYAREYDYSVPNSNRENVFLGMTGATASGTVDASTPITNLFNGRVDTGVKVAGTNGSYTLTLDLGEIKTLKEMRIFEVIGAANLIDGAPATASDSTKVEVYRDGLWHIVYTSLCLSTSPYTIVDMCGIDCEKVRITFQNTRLFDGESEYRTIELAEITCTTSAKQVDRAALLEELKKLPMRDSEDEINWRYIYNENYERFFGYASDILATQDEVDAYTAEIALYAKTINSANLTALNLSLGGDISMNFRYSVADVEAFAAYPDAYVEFTIPDVSGNTVVKVYFKDAEVDSVGRYILPVKLCAAQMADKVTLRAVFAEGVTGEIHSYSIRDYADYILANEEYEMAYLGINNLVKAMLNYGSYAQTHFGYNTSSLAANGIYTTATDPVLTTSITENSEVVISGEATGFAIGNWTLSLLSETTARIFFTVDGDIKSYEILVVYPSGEETSLSAYAEGDRYRIDIRDINAVDLDATIRVIVRNTTDSTECEISFSAMCYVASVLANDRSTDSAKNLVKALKLYNIYATEYFEKNN